MGLSSLFFGKNPSGRMGFIRNRDAFGEPHNLCQPCGVLAVQADDAGGEHYQQLCDQIWKIQCTNHRRCTAPGCAAK